MMNSENIQVCGVAETMLQTMYARAVYSQKPGHKFYDPIYRVIGKIPALRNLPNKLAVLEVCKNGE